jgi:hypothetical protein
MAHAIIRRVFITMQRLHRGAEAYVFTSQRCSSTLMTRAGTNAKTLHEREMERGCPGWNGANS